MFGLFSLLGKNQVEQIVKLADEYDKSGDKDKADMIDKLLNKMEDLKEEYREEFEKLESHLKEYREKYEDQRTDTSLLWQLSDAWFGSRQINK